MSSYYIYVHKNLLKVVNITPDMRLKFGGKIHVLDCGRVRILSKYSTKEVSAKYYSSPFRFRAQGLFDMPEFLKKAIVELSTHSHEVLESSDSFLLVATSFISRANTFLDTTLMAIDISVLILDYILLISSLLDMSLHIQDLRSSGMSVKTVLYFISLFVKIYNCIVNTSKAMIIPENITSTLKEIPGAFLNATNTVLNKMFRAQSAFNSLIFVSLLENMLPKQVRHLISRMPLYTRDKILDDSTIIEDIIGWLTSLPVSIAKALSLPDNIVHPLEYAMQCVPCSKSYSYKRQLVDFLDKVDANKSLSYNPVFQEQYSKFFNELIKWKNELSLDHAKLPYAFSDAYNRGFKLFKKIEYCRNTTRIEPVFLVFYGPAGTGKTTAMLQLVESLKVNNSVYSHVSHGVDKDFYDQYDGEAVVMYDDIGQKGVHQWADMINMVSTAQCTLNCASVENKDMKRFTSRLIIATTNNLDLRLTPADPISDIEALYRRIKNIDFSKVTFKNGIMSGDVYIKERDMINKRWVDIMKFPADQFLDKISTYVVDKVQEKSRIVPTKDLKIIPIPSLEAQSFSPRELFDTKFRDDKALQILNYIDAFFMFSYDHILPFLLSFIFSFACYFILYKFVDYFKSKRNAQPIVKKKFYYSDKKEVAKMAQFRPEANLEPLFLAGDQVESNTLNSFRKNSVVIVIYNGENMVATGTAMFSGRVFTTVRHNFALKDLDKLNTYIKVFTSPTHILYDMVPIEIVYHSDIDDIVIGRLKPSVPVFFRKIPFIKDSSCTDLCLVAPQACKFVGKITRVGYDAGYTAITGFSGVIDSDDITYNLQGEGLCGSWVVTKDGFIYGHHVAGDPIGKIGIARCFTRGTYEKLIMYCNVTMPILEVDFSKNFGNAGVVLDKDVSIFNQKRSTIVGSEVKGVFPIQRVPANLNPFGKDTVKNLMEPVMKEVPVPDLKALKWVKNYLRSVLPDFSPCTLEEAVKGYGDMSMLDLKTSAGYNFPGLKSDYITPTGELVNGMKEAVEKLESSFITDTYKYDSFHKACVKDELRNLEKVDKPRVFSSAPLDLVILQRKYLSQFLYKVHSKRFKFKTGVMVGINPFSSDWRELLDYITRNGDNVFDGDVPKWDQSVIVMFQNTLNEVIEEKFNGSSSQRQVLAYINQLMVTTPHVNTDIAYIDTHSIASGVVPTADGNSLINLIAFLYSFYMLHLEIHKTVPTFDQFSRNISFAAYGDDSLVGVHPSYKWFCPSNIKRIFNTLGMDYTPADKGEWKIQFKSIYESSFLKRGFRFHHKINDIVGPLDPLSMCSTLNFVKDNFRNRELTTIKILNFQREAYLHAAYLDYMKHLSEFLEVNAPFYFKTVTFHSEEYLLELYSNGDYNSLLELH